VVVAQVRLGGERQQPDVLQRFDVVRVNALLGERLPIMRNVLVSVTHAPLQPLQLEGRDFVAACDFNGIQSCSGLVVSHMASSPWCLLSCCPAPLGFALPCANPSGLTLPVSLPARLKPVR